MINIIISLILITAKSKTMKQQIICKINTNTIQIAHNIFKIVNLTTWKKVVEKEN